jgi:ABC-2 type transport system ATP-binding protein
MVEESPPAPAIACRGLTKYFDGLLAVDGLTLEVRAGEVLGLLGPNGAGKTTTVRMLAGLVAPTAGEATVCGLRVGADNDAIRRRVGVLTESPGLYEALSAETNLTVYARLFGLADGRARVEKYLRLLGLWDRRGEAAGTFSKGMKQKLAIARALLHEPEVLFLDEPTSGLDPQMAKVVCDFVGQLRSEGRTILLCTHNLDEAERLCDRVAVVNTTLVALDRTDSLRARLFGRRTLVRLRTVDGAALEAVRALKGVRGVEQAGTTLAVTLDDPEVVIPEVVRALVGAGADVLSVIEEQRSLQDVYLTLIDEGART